MPRAPARPSSRSIGYAVVGLGHIAQAAVLPAFAHAKKNSRLVALVSDDHEKRAKLGRRYGLAKDALYAYEDFETCLRSEDVDAVYIALPNHLHREYTLRAARAGVHVLCEKPMAFTVKDCDAMIRACRDADVRLMIAYREHFEPATLNAVELVRKGTLGEPRLFESTFGFQVQEGNIRIDADKGGGPVWDIGIYCLNACRMLFGAEPTQVFAFSAARPDARFDEVPEAVSVVLTFPGERLATLQCSFGIASAGKFSVVGTEGTLELHNAYSYTGEHTRIVTKGGKSKSKIFPPGDQFAPELLAFSDCILTGRDPQPDGLEGRADVLIIQAIHRSLATGRPVKLPNEQPPRPVRPDQARHVPPVKEPPLVKVSAPHR